MGRTVPTFTNIIETELTSWSKYRRGLRKEDQEIFDDLFRAARLHLAENFYAMRTIPFESIAISMLLEQHKLIKHLQERLTEMEQRSRREKSVPLRAGRDLDEVEQSHLGGK